MIPEARFFLDRGMGSRIVPLGLREAGWQVVTMDERYGVVDSQSIQDVEWIADASARDELIIAKDRAIAKRPLEAEALLAARARVLILASSNLTGPQMLQRLIENAPGVSRLAEAEGPFVMGVDLASLHPIRIRTD